MYPANTTLVLRAMGYTPGAIDENDFIAANVNGEVSIEWNHTDPQPTEQQINDYAADVTPLPSGQLFSEWQTEHGGNALATLRRQAKEALDGQDRDHQALIRALALVVLDEINTLRAQHALAPRTANQLRNAIKARITAGDADA